MTTDFKSLEELKSVIQINYIDCRDSNKLHFFCKKQVVLTHQIDGQKVSGVLIEGISENDLIMVKESGFWNKVRLVFNSPYAIANKNRLMQVYTLARRNHNDFGWGDVAFYDLAKKMTENISASDKAALDPKKLSEKGFINTFNHVTSEAIMTSIFSEKLADFIADIHERKNLPSLVTGDFTEEQLNDILNGPVDNYVDMINNEWGQELGKHLKKKYQINQNTIWTPELLANYLNDVRSYFSWVFNLSIAPFSPEEIEIVRFSRKINYVKKYPSGRN